MRTFHSLALAFFLSAPLAAQSLGGRAALLRHATVTGLSSAPAAAPGGQVTLWAEVTPKPGIHIYAAGAKEFSPVALTLVSQSGVTAAAPSYPPPAPSASLKTIDSSAPAYYATFRITQPITIAKSAKPGQALTVHGNVSYQACDDRLCYPVTSEAVAWTLTVK